MKATSLERKYIQTLKSNIGKMTDIKKAFISDIKTDIRLYISEHTSLTYESLCDNFGDPENVANDFLSREDYSDLAKKAKKYKIWKIVAIVAIILFVAFIATIIPVLLEIGGTITVTDDFNNF